MTFPKAIMTIKELVTMGFSEEQLRDIYHAKGYPIAFKENPTKITCPIKFDTKELEKYLRFANKMENATRGVLL